MYFSIVSRLRLTPSRAAAASQKAAAAAAATTNSLSLSCGGNDNNSPSSSGIRSAGKHRSKQRHSRRRSHQEAPEASSVDSATKPLKNSSDTDEPAEDLDTPDRPGPSSRQRLEGDSQGNFFPYRLRSRSGADATGEGCTLANARGKESKDKSHRGITNLRVAHILSEKERNLKKGPSKSSATPASTTSTSLSSTNTTRLTGRGGSTTASSSNTTGSCASSR